MRGIYDDGRAFKNVLLDSDLTVFPMSRSKRFKSFSRSLRNLVKELESMTESSGAMSKKYLNDMSNRTLNDVHVGNIKDRFEKQVFKHANRINGI